MRYIDANILEPLSTRNNGPWRIEDDRILKTSAHGEPLRTVEAARAVYDAYQVAYEAGVGTPRPFEVVCSGDAFGVVVEYVRGLGMIKHVVFGSYTPREAGQAMGELMCRLHGVRVTEGRDVNATFQGYARTLEPLLPHDVGRQLVSLVEAIPNSNVLLHGDFHLGNVVV